MSVVTRGCVAYRHAIEDGGECLVAFVNVRDEAISNLNQLSMGRSVGGIVKRFVEFLGKLVFVALPEPTVVDNDCFSKCEPRLIPQDVNVFDVVFREYCGILK